MTLPAQPDPIEEMRQATVEYLQSVMRDATKATDRIFLREAIGFVTEHRDQQKTLDDVDRMLSSLVWEVFHAFDDIDEETGEAKEVMNPEEALCRIGMILVYASRNSATLRDLFAAKLGGGGHYGPNWWAYINDVIEHRNTNRLKAATDDR